MMQYLQSGDWVQEWSAAAGFMGALLTALLIVKTQRWHGALSYDQTNGVQKFHEEPTPRVGGLAIFLGTALSLWGAERTQAELVKTILLAGAPAFAMGLAEDLSKRIGVWPRLWATMVSGGVAIAITGYILTRVDVAFMDALLATPWIAVVFTVFAVGGVANAVNIIDGFNGLSISTVFFALLSYAWMAAQLGDWTLCNTAISLAAVALGLLVVNWPLGKIFLGDGGAYFLGFALSWMAVLLIARNPEVSTFAVLLVCAYPVTESLFSVYRRIQAGRSPGHPDRLHFHSLVKRRLVNVMFRHQSMTWRNSLTGLIVGSITLITGCVAGLTYLHHGWSVLALTAAVLGYVVLYRGLIHYRRH